MLLSKLVEHLLCLVETDFHVIVSTLQGFNLLNQVDYVCVKVSILVVKSLDFSSASLAAGTNWSARNVRRS